MASPATSKILVLALGFSVFAAAPALASDPTPPATGQAAASPLKNDTGKRVCRTITPTGSRFSQRVCQTQDEWDKQKDDAERHMDEARSGVRDNGCGIGCPQ